MSEKQLVEYLQDWLDVFEHLGVEEKLYFHGCYQLMNELGGVLLR